ncbi:hypothetical protein CRUP_018177 [Coryphaenoides rupestris]|nr:hypothetical protein CRUP_018177 [Coryphaenoides rupestris]
MGCGALVAQSGRPIEVITGGRKVFTKDDEVVLQCVACIQKENRKFCLTAEGLGNRLCYLEPTSEAKIHPASLGNSLCLAVPGTPWGEACWWTIHPASKQRSEGEKVRIGDDLILVSVSSERYLHLSISNGSIQVDASFMQTLWNVHPTCSGSNVVEGRGCVDVWRSRPLTHSSSSPRIVNYETGKAGAKARSLWRLEPLRISWSGSHIRWGQPFRLRHLTRGHYLALTDDRGLVLQDREKADTTSTAFCFRSSKVTSCPTSP